MLIAMDQEMKRLQLQDSSLAYFFKEVKQPHSVFFLDRETGVLMRKIRKKSPSGEKFIKEVLVLPSGYREEAMRICHDNASSGAHLGEKKSMDKITDRFWWPHMRSEFQFWIASCPECIARKPSSAPNVGQLQSIPVSYPFELVGIDVLGGIPVSDSGNRSIVVFTDHFTKWVEAFAVPSHDAETIAKLLVHHIFMRFGTPKKLLSDRGPEFMSALVKEILKVMEIESLNTSAYHPQTDGHTERMNKTLINMLAAYVNVQHTNWDEVLPFVLFAYRTSIHASTGYTPFYLMHGVDARFPVDVSIKPSVTAKPAVQEHINALQKNLVTAYDVVRGRIQLAQSKQAYWYNQKAKPEREYAIGDLVMEHAGRPTADPTKKKNDPDYTPLAKRSVKLDPKWKGPFEVIA
jgi:hypothetical protein